MEVLLLTRKKILERSVTPLGSRATRGVTVLVRDDAGRPVEGATVSFSLPAQGPGGVFASGARTEIVQTASDGRAAAWGMRWNRSPGEFEMRVTAMKGQALASTSVAQALSAAQELRVSVPRSSGGHKILWIALAGGAAAAVAGVRLDGLESPVTVHLAGGDLVIEVDDDLGVTMTGPAEPIYSGRFAPALMTRLENM